MEDAKESLQHIIDDARRKGEEVEQEVESWLMQKIIEDENAEIKCFSLQGMSYLEDLLAWKESSEGGEVCFSNSGERGNSIKFPTGPFQRLRL